MNMFLDVRAFPVKKGLGFKRIIVFGDSLSDNGVSFEPIREDRHGFLIYTNGPVWSQYLVEILGMPQSMTVYCTVLYSTVLYCTLLYSTLLYSTLLYSTLLYSTVLYCTVLYCTVLYCTVL